MNKMNKLFFSVVIPSYNEMANLQKGVLDKVAHFLAKQKYSYEVIIVDDGSTDGTSKFIKSNYPEINIIKGPGDWWWTKSMNSLIKKVGGIMMVVLFLALIL